MKNHCWSETRIKKHIKQQEEKDPKLKNLIIPSNNIHYLNGLLATDGNIRNNRQYQCRLILKDITLLYKIKDIFGGLIHKHHKGYLEWSTSYRPFISYLDSIGIQSRKTFNLDMTKYFSELTDKEKWHFIRGCIDGDGCFSFTTNKTRTRGRFNIVGASKSFMYMLYNFLGENCNIYTNKTGKIYTICINGKYVKPMLSNVYNLNSNSLYLERKYNVYNEIIKYYSKRHIKKWRSINKFMGMEILDYCKTHTIKDTSKLYNISETQIRRWCKRDNIQWYKKSIKI